jgi:energy-coupling factor transporter ATP-binding protein EcfA2
MRIHKIIVTELFGNLNHEIPLHESGVTLLHGPNGSGKTTVLKLLKAIFEFDVQTLLTIKFKDCLITYDNGNSLKVYGDPNKRDEIKIRYNQETEHDVWNYTLRTHDPLPSFQEELTAFNIEFIQEQRLLRVNKHKDADDEVVDVIHEFSSEIKNTIVASLNQSAIISQNSERSFPQRLLSFDNDRIIPEENIRGEYSKTQDKIKRLMKIGLIESEEILPLPDKKLDETFIIATHSPQIIGSRRDLAVALDGGILYAYD